MLFPKDQIMKTRNHNCENRLFGYPFLFLLLIGVLTISACKKDSDPPVGPPEEDLLVQGAVTPSGGILSADDITVEIPAGAFQTTEQLEIYRVNIDSPFGASSLTDVFKVTGFPNEFGQQIILKLKVDGPPDGDGFIAVEKEMYVPSAAESRLVYEPFVATSNPSYLEVQLEAGDVFTSLRHEGAEVRGSKSITVNGFTGFIHQIQGDFELIYPKTVVLNTQELTGLENLRAALEMAKSNLVDKYHFKLDGRTKWPMKIIIKPLSGSNDAGEPNDGEAVLSFWDSGTYNYGPNSGVIYINYSQLKNKQAIQTTAAHEFFHLVQYLYTNDHRYDWMREASSTWFECAFAADPENYVPAVWNVPEYKRSLFDGLHAGSLLGKSTSDGKGVTPSRHGYGAFPVIRYLDDRYGNSALELIWSACKNGAHPLEAISWHTAAYSEWWNDFLSSYYQEEVVNGTYLESLLLPQANIKTLAKADKDTVFTFQSEMYDLSGGLYKVIVPTTGYTDEHQLELKITPSAGPKLFIYQPGTGATRELIAQGNGQIIINDWSAVATKGAIYILVGNDRFDVVNPLVKTPVKIEGHIAKAVGPSTWTKCILDFQIRGNLTKYYPATQTYVTEDKTFGHASDISGNGPMIGSVNNLTFQGANSKEQINVTFDPSGKNITSFHWTGTGVGSNFNPCNMTLTGGNIPIYGGIPWFKTSGSEMCLAVSEFTFYKSDEPSVVYTLNSWFCNDNVYLYLFFE